MGLKTTTMVLLIQADNVLKERLELDIKVVGYNVEVALDI